MKKMKMKSKKSGDFGKSGSKSAGGSCTIVQQGNMLKNVPYATTPPTSCGPGLDQAKKNMQDR